MPAPQLNLSASDIELQLWALGPVESWDSPEPVKQGIIQALNQCRWANVPRTDLDPLILRLGMTRSAAPDSAYGFAVADLACRVFAPAALRKAGLETEADKLAGLAPIVDDAAARAAAHAADAAHAARAAAARAARAAAAKLLVLPFPESQSLAHSLNFGSL
jgi:hypothetical protein